jgi:hypothetical protein
LVEIGGPWGRGRSVLGGGDGDGAAVILVAVERGRRGAPRGHLLDDPAHEPYTGVSHTC